MAKKINNRPSSKNNNSTTSTSSGVSRVAWASLVLSLASQASGFHSSPRERMFATTSGPAHQHHSGGPYSQVSESRTSRSRRHMSTTTQLGYRDGDVDSNSVTIDSQLGWWNNIFPSSRRNDEQETVDEYLEFLDRRYNRLRSSNEDGDAKPLSALNWLLQGAPKRNDAKAAAQQREDSLYVLGVAGLASEKLLQKHHLAVPESQQQQHQPKHIESPTKIIEALSEEQQQQETPSTRFIKMVLVPIIRKYVILQRSKDVFVEKQIQRARIFAVAAAKVLARSLVQGPVVTGKALLDIGGGKQSIAMTITAVSTVLLILRPMFQAAIAESTNMAGTITP